MVYPRPSLTPGSTARSTRVKAVLGVGWAEGPADTREPLGVEGMTQLEVDAQGARAGVGQTGKEAARDAAS